MAEHLISVEEATGLIHAIKFEKPAVHVPLAQALGRFTASPWLADTDLPPFDRVMMDGVAINLASFNTGRRNYDVEGIQRAGAPQQKLNSTDSGCIEVMTGAVCPKDADAVVPYEQLTIGGSLCSILSIELKPGQNIHLRGSDRKKNDLLVGVNSKIGTAEIGVAASIGLATVNVRAMPTVCIISTGDELVEVTEMPEPHQIRRSNVHALAALLYNQGLIADLLHIADEETPLLLQLSDALKKYDVLILSGGVSKGKYDLIPEVMHQLGVQKLFHRIAQKPGKPMWFGKTESCVVFGLPGNPVSTFMCAVRYVIPWLQQAISGESLSPAKSMLATDYSYKSGLTQFVQVKLQNNQEGQVIAIPVPGGGSGDFVNLMQADAFLELPSTGHAVGGGLYPVWRYRL